MTKMKSFRIQERTTRLIEFLQMKTGYSQAELIDKALWELMWAETTIDKKGRITHWSKDEYLLDK